MTYFSGPLIHSLTIIRAAKTPPSYSLQRYIQDEPSIIEHVRYRTTAEAREAREITIRNHLENLSSKLKDTTPITAANDQMMRKLEIMEECYRVK